MRVLVCDPIDEKALARMKEAGLEVVVRTGMSVEELAEAIKGFHAAVVRSATKVRKPVIEAATDLKIIVRGGVGIDNIDVDAAKAKGIEVRNTPAASSESVAELALGHMFAVARFIAAANVTMRKGEWNKKQYKGLELAGKMLGIIGIGRIGQHLARKAMGIGMKVQAYDKYVQESPVEGVAMVDMDTLLTTSDFVSLHVPYVKEEGAVIGREELAKMKDGAILINCARGGVVDEEALIEALDSGKLWGAGVDVFESEPNPNPKLVNHPRVSVTPHVGASTREAQARVGAEVADILIAFAKEHGL